MCKSYGAGKDRTVKVYLREYNVLITLSYSRNLFNGVFLPTANVTVQQ